MKPFLKKFTQVGGIVALALVLGIGVSVFADNYVGAPAFPQNAPTPLNVTNTEQTKGDFQTSLRSLLKVGGSAAVKNGLTVVENAQVGGLKVGIQDQPSSIGGAVGNVFGKLFINNTTDDRTSGLKIGGSSTGGLLTDSLRAALDIDLTGRTNAGGTDGISVKSAAGALTSAFITNSQVFHFYSDLVTKDARIWAGSIKLSDYSPSAGKVLVSGDSEGNAVWGTLKAGGGVPLTGNDVLVLGRYYDNDGSAKVHTAWAYCPSSYVAVSGGGDCEAGALMISQPIHSDFGNPGAYAGGPGWSDQSSSNPGGYTYVPGTDKVANYGRFPNGWQVKCSQGKNDDLHINVVCLKITPPTVTTTYPAPTAVSAVGSPTASWKIVLPPGNAPGSSGQSCDSWLASLGQAGSQGPRTWQSNTNAIISGQCAYFRSSGASVDCTSSDADLGLPGYKPVSGCSVPNTTAVMQTQTYR